MNWEDPSELSPDQLLSYYVVWAMPVERNLEEPEKVPAEELEQKLQERFDVSAELLRRPNIMTRRPACIPRDMWGVPPGMR